MGIFRALNVSASGMRASRQRMDAAALNLANAESTSATPEGVFRPRRIKLGEAMQSFEDSLWSKAGEGGVLGEEHQLQLQLLPQVRHDPGHPDADANGNVYMAPVEVTDELAELMAARRAYQAGLTAYGQARETYTSTLEILRS